MADTAKQSIRTCIACGQKRPKLEMKRVVLQADGTVQYDATGRKDGRGAYICSADCLQKAVEKKLFSRALRRNVTGEALERVGSDMEMALSGAVAR